MAGEPRYDVRTDPSRSRFPLVVCLNDLGGYPEVHVLFGKQSAERHARHYVSSRGSKSRWQEFTSAYLYARRSRRLATTVGFVGFLGGAKSLPRLWICAVRRGSLDAIISSEESP
jgi:hypothetical protein